MWLFFVPNYYKGMRPPVDESERAQGSLDSAYVDAINAIIKLLNPTCIFVLK